MVHSMPCPAPELLFVASSLEDESQAQHELTQWAMANGYQPPQVDSTFVFYQDGAQVREWRLIERPVSETEH